MSASLRLPVLMIWFVLLWVALWGQWTVANFASGIVVAVVIVVVAPLPDAPRDLFAEGGALGRVTKVRIRPVRAAWFGIYFMYKLMQANVMLAWEVVTPRNSIKPGILGIPLSGCSDALVTMVANAFTLTPGSLTIEVRRDPTVIYVHVLHLNDPEAVRAELLHVAELAVRAFGPDEALAQFERAPIENTEVST